MSVVKGVAKRMDDTGSADEQSLTNAAVLMFRSGELSAGAACEFAGVDRLTFTRECQRRGNALVDYPAEDLRAELDSTIHDLDAGGC